MGRLTIQSGVPVPITDITAVQTLYYTSRLIPLYDPTSATWTNFAVGADLSMPVSASSHNQVGPFDVYVENAGTGTPRLVTGPAWAFGDTRDAAFALTHMGDGFYVNTAAISNCRFGNTSSPYTLPAQRGLFIGTIYMLSAGSLIDTYTRRNVWNNFNRVRRPLRGNFTPGSWTYSTAAWRLTNAVGYAVGYVRGLDEDLVELNLVAFVTTSTATVRTVLVGFSLDGSITFAANQAGSLEQPYLGQPATLASRISFLPGIGTHLVNGMEYGGGADVQTWYGGITGQAYTGMSGWCMA